MENRFRPRQDPVFWSCTQRGHLYSYAVLPPGPASGGCLRLCMVEASGARTLVASCVYPVSEGMVVKTNTSKVREARKTVLELLLTNHPKDCLCCQKNGDCELQKIAADLGVRSSASRVAKQGRVLLITVILLWYAIRKNAFSAAAAYVSVVMCRA